jgi:hypothetical protein
LFFLRIEISTANGDALMRTVGCGVGDGDRLREQSDGPEVADNAAIESSFGCVEEEAFAGGGDI